MKGVFCTRNVLPDLGREPKKVREGLIRQTGLSDARCLTQVHSNRVVLAEDFPGDEIPEADAVISTDPTRTTLCIRTADCVPVLAWSSDRTIVAAIHAGWRGLASGIIEKTLETMNVMGAFDLKVSIGPAIGPCCFEVGDEVADLLGGAHVRQSNGSLYADLWQTAVDQVLGSGVRRQSINCLRLCTCCHGELFFSYRRQGASAGRNLSVIGGKSWLLPGLQAE